MKPEEFRFSSYGVTEGAVLDVSFSIFGVYPKECRGVVEKVYPRFAIVKTRRYRVTIHYTDLLTGTASVQPAQGPEKIGNVVWLPSAIEKTELEGRRPRKRAAVR